LNKMEKAIEAEDFEEASWLWDEAVLTSEQARDRDRKKRFLEFFDLKMDVGGKIVPSDYGIASKKREQARRDGRPLKELYFLKELKRINSKENALIIEENNEIYEYTKKMNLVAQKLIKGAKIQKSLTKEGKRLKKGIKDLKKPKNDVERAIRDCQEQKELEINELDKSITFQVKKNCSRKVKKTLKKGLPKKEIEELISRQPYMEFARCENLRLKKRYNVPVVLARIGEPPKSAQIDARSEIKDALILIVREKMPRLRNVPIEICFESLLDLFVLD
ncbi:MAG: hypothetical protein ACTSRI_19225, partial [Promethearchaeota archaeon]